MKIFSYNNVIRSSVEGWNLRGNENFQFLEFWPLSDTGIADAVFSTRRGGASIGPCGGMNLNLYKKFDLESGHQNFRLFLKLLNIKQKSVATTRLIYITDEVRRVERPGEFDIFDEAMAPHADAIITNNPDVTLFLYAADCAIIYLVDPVHRAIGLVHAAWRTALKGIIGNTISEMARSYGTNPKRLITMIAPCLGKENFEVSEGVAEQFELIDMGDMIVREPRKRPRLDYYEINVEFLRRSGVSSENIYATRDLCTFRDEDLFHSFRRGPVKECPDGTVRHLNGLNGAFLSLRK